MKPSQLQESGHGKCPELPLSGCGFDRKAGDAFGSDSSDSRVDEPLQLQSRPSVRQVLTPQVTLPSQGFRVG